jgi:hypothetical protein
MAAIVGVAALIIPVFAPGRDGQQLRAVRRLTARNTRMQPATAADDLKPFAKDDT